MRETNWAFTAWCDGKRIADMEGMSLIRSCGKPPLVTVNGVPVAGHFKIIADSGNETVVLFDGEVGE